MRRRQTRKPMSEINVVPYIDVMLVLLVIFIITAPLLNQGVKVELPEAQAKPMNAPEHEALVVTVDRAGAYYVDDKKIDAAALKTKAAAILAAQPRTPVLVRGDHAVAYGAVVKAMVLLQQSGARRVGLVTEPPKVAR